MRRYFTGLFLVALASIGIIAWWVYSRPTPPRPVIIAASQPTTHPSTLPVLAPLPAKIASYIDVVRAGNPNIPATQPLAVPVDLPDAAHVILRDPIYLDGAGHLWITRADGRPTEDVLRRPLDPSEHVIPDRPVFVHWWTNDAGDWTAAVIAHSAAGGYNVLLSLDRKHISIDRAFAWDRAFSWDGKMVVPSEGGISVFEIQPAVVEHYHALPGMEAGVVPTAILDSKGILAWGPWDNGHTGSHRVARFVDGQWADLPTDQWPERIMQLLPLLDGSILQVIAGEEDKVSLAIAPLESTGIDEHRISELVDSLADPDEDKRQAAFTELSRYGPGLWPILEKLSADESPEAQIRIRQLLRSKVTPALGGISLLENRLRVVNRQPDGTVLLYAPVGVKIPGGGAEAQTVTPAWLVLRNGGRVERPLPQALVADQKPEDCRLRAVRDDWVLCDSTGARRFFGNGFVPLTTEGERQFDRLLGVDRRGRWIFSADHSATTQGADPASTDTLLIDPTILDPTPRLPVWTIKVRDGLAGWDALDYPCIKRGGAWALKEDSWEPLAEKNKFITELPNSAPPPDTSTPAATPSTSQASTQPAPAKPLLVSTDGTQYFDGRSELISIDKTGRRTTWPLPPTASGDADPTLIQSFDGRLFLFNQPGRVVRIKATPSDPSPFQIEATFTKDIPNIDRPTRIWLDPLGRINFIYNGNILAVMFPSGHIPPQLSQMMMDSSAR